MQINTMISQLAGGMLVSTEIFVVTLVFSLPLGLLIAFDAAADGRLFWTVLSVWH